MWTYSTISKQRKWKTISKAKWFWTWTSRCLCKSYLGCARLFKQFYDRRDGVASYDGIVYENYSFAGKVVRQRPKFLSHPELTQTGVWLNKRPADIAVFTQDLDVGQARLQRQNNTCCRLYNSQIQTWRELSSEKCRTVDVWWKYTCMASLYHRCAHLAIQVLRRFLEVVRILVTRVWSLAIWPVSDLPIKT